MKLLYLQIALLLLGCGTSNSIENPVIEGLAKEDITTQQSENGPVDSHNFKVSITHYTPYCGGAAPPPDIMERSTQQLANTNFILINHRSGKKTIVQTDSQGILYLMLSEGAYAIRETYKNCSFDEFYEKNHQTSDEWLQPSPDPNCYRNWWADNLQEIVITKVDSIYTYEVQTFEACFVGQNPCINYVGPLPT